MRKPIFIFIATTILIQIRVFAQITDTEKPELSIHFWLKNHELVNDAPEYESVHKIFRRLLSVADKPIGVLPQFYIFSDLSFDKTMALPDGSIILPAQVIDFCFQNPERAEARLAFVLGHELKHILRGDYLIKKMILQFPAKAGETRFDQQVRRYLHSE